MDSLIEKLERATGHDRALDDALWAAHKGYEFRWCDGGRPDVLIPKCYCMNHPDGEPHWRKFENGDGPPLYTASLDAKLPVEKEGWWQINGPRRYLNIPSPVPNYWRAELTLWEPMREFIGWGATEALARRIAALKALKETGR